MNTEQERAEFEAWYLENNDVPHEAIKRKGAGYAWIGTDEAWEIWQAAQATLQSQDREDAERLDWIEANHGCDITECADGAWEVDVPDGPYGVGKGMREAIDHARHIESKESK